MSNITAKVFVAFLLTYGLFEVLARQLGSDRGQAGLLVGSAVLLVLLAIEWSLFAVPPSNSWRTLGLGRPSAHGLLAACLVTFSLLLAISVLTWATGIPVTIDSTLDTSVVGIAAQAGIAEEALFRGFVFRRLRERRTFRSAATVSAMLFALAHAVMFITFPWHVATAALLLSAALAYPLGRLFELGGNTLWPPALLHAVIQIVPKVVHTGDQGSSFALAWMAACALIPQLVFLIPKPGGSAAVPQKSVE